MPWDENVMDNKTDLGVGKVRIQTTDSYVRPFAARFLAVSPVERVKRGSGGGVREEGGLVVQVEKKLKVNQRESLQSWTDEVQVQVNLDFRMPHKMTD
ncbi:hypothetical protein F2P79_012470 [Pimephales promelas]|nr:hypothetical protein F2P79_012470 [Pimephales promelas]